MRCRCCGIRARHRHDIEARARTERDYQQTAIEQERERLGEAHKTAWRRGWAETAELPLREFAEAVTTVIRDHCRRLGQLFKEATKSAQEGERQRQNWERAREQSRGRDDDYGWER